MPTARIGSLQGTPDNPEFFLCENEIYSHMNLKFPKRDGQLC